MGPPTKLLILLARFNTVAPILPIKLVPVLLVGNCLVSSLGLDNCNPTCLVMNNGPLGKSVKNLPIRKVSVNPAFNEPTAPPRINPSSNLVIRKRLNPLSTVLISVTI